MSQADNVNIVK